MFDTHCHLNFSRFKNNLSQVVDYARKGGVNKIVVPGTDISTSQEAIEISHQFEGVYAAVGIHPHHAYELYHSSILLSQDQLGSLPIAGPVAPHSTSQSEGSFRSSLPQTTDLRNKISDLIISLEQMLQNPKVVAIGEIGIDKHEYKMTKHENYAITPEFITLQKKLVERQIDLGLRNNKSIILHNREAREDLMDVLTKVDLKQMEYRTVFHCCEPDAFLFDFAKANHFFIGVDGDVTYWKEKQEFIKEVPFEMLVLETDAPFLLPEPLRAEKKYPNNPGNIPIIAKFIANLKGESVEVVDRVTTENARRLFNLPEDQ